MTYVRQQTSEELAAHMRYLQGLPGWHDPLADRLWQEIETLRAENAGLQTGYKAYEQVNAELRAENERLRDGMVKIIEMNRMHAECQYGDPEKAEAWSCVTVARAAMGRGEQSNG